LAFDSSIGRVNYLTGVSVDTRMWDPSYFRLRIHQTPRYDAILVQSALSPGGSHCEPE